MMECLIHLNKEDNKVCSGIHVAIAHIIPPEINQSENENNFRGNIKKEFNFVLFPLLIELVKVNLCF